MSDDKFKQLASKFITGKVPTDADFIELIDLADKANRALGLLTAPDKAQDLKGLEKKDPGPLMVKLAKNAGLALENGRLRVIEDTAADASVSVDKFGIHLTPGPGVTFNQGEAQLAPWPGVHLDNNNLRVTAGEGISLSGNKLDIHYGAGITTHGERLVVNVPGSANPDNKQSTGLVADDSGLKLNITGDNLTINGNGELTLSAAAIAALTEGSIARFNTALADAQQQAVDDHLVAERDNTLNGTASWATPLETVYDRAFAYGQGEMLRAKESLQARIAKFMTDNADKKPQADNIRINFSAAKKDNTLYYSEESSGWFPLNKLHVFNSLADIATPNVGSGEITLAALGKTGFYALIGAVNRSGKTGVDSLNGPQLTANAVMVYIGELDTLTLGFWDLTAAAPVWYQNEADHGLARQYGSAYPMTRKSIEDITGPQSISVDDSGDQIAVLTNNLSDVSYQVSPSDALTINASSGKITPLRWSKNVVITAHQAATRTHNADSKDYQLAITPRANNAIHTSALSIKMGNNDSVNLTGGNRENGRMLPCTYSSSDSDIVTVDSDGTINTHRQGSASITVHQDSGQYYDTNASWPFTIHVGQSQADDERDAQAERDRRRREEEEKRWARVNDLQVYCDIEATGRWMPPEPLALILKPYYRITVNFKNICRQGAGRNYNINIQSISLEADDHTPYPFFYSDSHLDGKQYLAIDVDGKSMDFSGHTNSTQQLKEIYLVIRWYQPESGTNDSAHPVQRYHTPIIPMNDNE